ncbi:DNA primase DnaG [Halobacterium litoreum]|uniref:DNA primase DnaG n=1 Tax=Halobacterium litoreum TaxID=2039234 RepID=A0ABD5ND65_9EURY|nr:DNA primase DnaG [Halobacterium litoreum]UHH13894.1 DNA primase [Halobacterium litoreum]
MEDTAKYLIHADLVADGIVERSDVVGAAFGQTEGLLGDDLDIRDLQDSAKLGRIDVSVDSEGGQSFGHITIASSLDRVETATLAAALEAVERIGPCRAQVEVNRIEDVRAAKRREVVDRAKELLANAFDEGAIDSDDILREVRESVRVEDITDYEGYPAGPNVASSDAVVVVEGRADVVTLLGYGIKNAVAVEGTNVPEEIAALTNERTTTAFLDGDRGGDLIRRELEQVGDVDYVARAPAGESVEDLSRQAVDTALREKQPVGDAEDAAGANVDAALGAEEDEATAATDGSATPAPAATDAESPSEPSVEDSATEADDAAAEPADEAVPKTLADHVDEVVGAGTVRLLGDDLDAVCESPAGDAFDALESADTAPNVVVVDGTVTQKLLDLAAQRGVGTVVGADTGEFVKQPASVRVHDATAY